MTVLRPSPAPLELARALIDLGAAYRRASARTRAREILREGLDLAHAMGGLALSDRARRELVVAGGRPRRDATRGRDALTPGELRVAQLAVAGRTNRQIAQALFVTQRTVCRMIKNLREAISQPPGPGSAASCKRQSFLQSLITD